MWNRRFFPIRPVLSAAIATVIVLGPGCGKDDGLSPRFPVSGKVTYKGEPVKKAVINFVPNDPEGRPAGGTVEDGQYELTTLNPKDGALPGKYKVTIDDRALDPNAMRSEADSAAKKKGVTYTAIPQELQAKALKSLKSSLPGKYQIASTSDLEVEIKPQSNTLNLDLKD
jgi:hypothetical protein